jgi:hypothetical protein
VELRGLEPLTPSLRTRGGEGADGHCAPQAVRKCR